MSQHNYTIYGTVRDQFGAGVPGVRVSVDTNETYLDPLDPLVYGGVTDSEGNYVISFVGNMLTDMFTDTSGGYHDHDEHVRLTVVASGDIQIGMLELLMSPDDICWGFEQDLDVVVEVSEDCCCPPAEECEGYTVYGIVRDQNHAPAPDLTVTVHSKNFRTTTPITSGETDDFGRYDFDYLEEEICRASGPGIQIFMTASDEVNDPGVIVATSEVVMHPSARQRIDFGMECVGAQLTEYEAVRTAIVPYMENIVPEEVDVGQLQAHDFAYLAEKSELEEGRVERFLVAMDLYARWRNLSPTPNHVKYVCAEMIFAFVAQDAGRSLTEIAFLGEVELLEMLTSAIAEGLVIETADKAVDEEPPPSPLPSNERRIEELVSALLWNVIDDTSTTLGHLFSLGAFTGANPSADKRALLDAYRAHSGDPAAFWMNYGAGGVDTAQLLMHMKLVSHAGRNRDLVDHLLATEGPFTPETIRLLATKTESDWLTIVSAIPVPVPYAGDSDPDKRAQFAKAMRRSCEYMFPEVAITHRLAEGFDCSNPGGCVDAEKIGGACPCQIYQAVLDDEDFSLRDTVIDDHYNVDPDNPGALASPSLAVRNGLKIIQRLYGVVPDFDAAPKIRAFVDAGYESAQELAGLGQSDFVAQFSGVMGGEHPAMLAFYRAELVDTTVANMVSRASRSLHPSIAGIGGPQILDPSSAPDASVTNPTLEKLFGSFDHCSCRHCNSVLSPAAYMVDLLAYIGKQGRDVIGCECDSTPDFAARRPDLCHTHLNCGNTQTPLPHIDLVNELLEERTMSANGQVEAADANPRQTTWTADQLLAHPEHLDYRAYEALRGVEASQPGTAGREYFAAVRPWILPFDLFLDEARAYTQQMGSPLGQLVSLLETDAPTREARTRRERLGLSKASHTLLVETDPPDDAFPERGASMAWFGDPRGHKFSDDVDAFRNARPFLNATGLELYEAFDLLDTHWAGRLESAQSKIALVYGDDAPCDLSQASFVPTPDLAGQWSTRLSRVHRFVRLWRSLSHHADAAYRLSIDELDEAIQKLQVPSKPVEINDDFLIQLDHFVATRRRFSGLSVMELLSWWGDLEARPDKTKYIENERTAVRTQYERLFLNIPSELPDSVRTHLTIEHDVGDGSFDLAAVGSAVILYNSDPLEDHAHMPFIAAAFGVSLDHLIALIERSDLERVPSTSDPALNLRNLSLLHMRISMARALDIDALELMDWEARTGVLLTDSVGDSVFATGEAPQLLAEIERLEAFDLGIEEIAFILDQNLPEKPSVTLSRADTLRLVLSSLATVGAARAEAPASVEDIPGPETELEKYAVLRDELLPLLETPTQTVDRTQLDIVVRGDTTNSPAELDEDAEWAAWINANLDGHFAPLFRSVESDGGLLYDHLGLTALVGENARARQFVVQFLNYEMKQALAPAIAEQLAGGLGLPVDTASSLLSDFAGQSVLQSFIDAGERLGTLDTQEIAALLALPDDRSLLDQIDNAISPTSRALYEGLYNQIRAVQPGALLLSRLKIEGRTLDWMRAAPDACNTSDPTHAAGLALLLPDQLDPPTADLPALLRLIDFVRIGRLICSEFNEWLVLLSQSTCDGKQDIDLIEDGDLEHLAQAAGWDTAILRSLIQDAAVRPLLYGELRDFAGLEEVAQCMLIQAANKATFADMVSWIADDSDPTDGEVTRDQAQRIKLHTQSLYSERAWSAVAQPLRDELRNRQRDALAAYVQDYYDYHPEKGYDLHSWLLIDVDMSPCAPTSRIKAAVGALQLLVQRWQLGIEHEDWSNESVARDSKVKEWLWRGRYRVWEAQRKVYLYPENWLDPALRDDKTELFQEFEDVILGSEISEANVEKALTGYLSRLDEMGRLEVNGMFHELEYGSHNKSVVVRDVLHVFARTRGKSGSNYYRTRLGGDAGKGWTPWVKIPFEIDAKDVLPVVFNRRLMVIWPRIEKRPDEIVGAIGEGEQARPTHHYRIHLAWSELHHGQWSEPKETEAFLTGRVTPNLQAKHDVSQTTLHHSFQGDELLVSVTQYVRSKSNFDNLVGDFHFGGCDGSVRAELRNERLDGPRPKPKKASEKHQGFFSRDNIYPPPIGKFWDDRTIFQTTQPNTRFELVTERAYDGNAEAWDISLFYQDATSSLLLSKDLYSRGPNPYALEGVFNSNTLGFLDADDQRNASLEIVANDVEPGFRLRRRYDSELAYHPYVCLMTQQVDRRGVEGLYRPDPNAASEEVSALVRQSNEKPLFNANGSRFVTPVAGGGMRTPFAKAQFEFAPGSYYGVYNWELFYHIPIFIAQQLAASRRYPEALKWFHYVFDPTATKIGADATDFWRFHPFENDPAPLQRLLTLLTSGKPVDPELKAEIQGLTTSLQFAQDNPFNPHGVARLRTTPFQISTVMKYLDTLIAWGDDLFRQETIESVGEATQIYVLAHNLLGPRPVELPAQGRGDYGYCQLGSTSILNNTMVAIEDRMPPGGRENWIAFPIVSEYTFGTQHQLPSTIPCVSDPSVGGDVIVDGGALERAAVGISDVTLYRSASPRPMQFHTFPVLDEDDDPTGDETLFFCIPVNDKIINYWDEVDDRLYKIRHCLNLQGQLRNIKLFEDPIDPGALIEALAGGASLSDAIADLNTPPPIYRFHTHLSVAKDFAKELESLGAELLSALERKDGEELAQLRADHDLRLLDKVEQVLLSRVEEARAARSVLDKAQATVEDRRIFYANRERNSTLEKQQSKLINATEVLHHVAGGFSGAAAVAALVPDFTVGVSGFAGSPVVVATYGGSNFASSFSSIAATIQSNAAAKSAVAQTVGIQASHDRRTEDWDHQQSQASKELERIAADEVTADVRIEIAQRELQRHEQQRKNAQEIKTFLQTKFTSEELFSWMSRQLQRIFYQTYQLAFDLAKRAELCFKAEIPDIDKDFITYGAWEGARKGLLSGQRLSGQLRELEAEYFTSNAREYELTKRISLNELDPWALTALRMTGACYFDVPEVYYDLDHPGHYLRRIKSVSLSIPCVAGSFDNFNANLSLVRSSVRPTATAGAHDDNELIDDPRGGMTTIATSRGDQDSGMFETRLDDPRYLPFENKGAISSWHLRLPQKFRQFDYETISDVVLTVRYMARDGGVALRDKAEEKIGDGLLDTPRTKDGIEGMSPLWMRAWPVLAGGISPSLLLSGMSVRSMFPYAWQRFSEPPEGTTPDLMLENVGRHLSDPVADDLVDAFFVIRYAGDAPTDWKIGATSDGSDPSPDRLLEEVELPAIDGEKFFGAPGVSNSADTLPLEVTDDSDWRIRLSSETERAKVIDVIVFYRHKPVNHGG